MREPRGRAIPTPEEANAIMGSWIRQREWYRFWGDAHDEAAAEAYATWQVQPLLAPFRAAQEVATDE